MAKSVLLVDNFDSFTYNIVHLIRECSGLPVVVERNDVARFNRDSVSHIVFSPGPGLPSEAGRMPALLREAAGSVPILGVCLGHQCIGEAFGGRLKQLRRLVHGVAKQTSVSDSLLFEGVPRSFRSGRYHSWTVDAAGLPDVLRVIATDDDGEIMALEHRSMPIYGVQFHPESILTEHGSIIMRNFLKAVI